MVEDNLNNNIPEVEDTASQPTEKLSRVTEEMLDNFAPKKDKDEAQIDTDKNNEEIEAENISDQDLTADNTDLDEQSDDSTKKTVVDFSEDSDDEKNVSQKTTSDKKKSNKFIKILIWIFVICLCGFLVFGIWNRWFRYNDEADIVSKWQISDTDKVLQIDKNTITINSSTVLNYKLDTFAKVINYEIGDMKGSSHYRFSWDRNQLAIVENCSPDFMPSIFSDIGYFWDWATCNMSKIDLSPAYTKNNKQEVDTENTGLDDIMKNGQVQSILLDKISTKKTENN